MATDIVLIGCLTPLREVGSKLIKTRFQAASGGAAIAAHSNWTSLRMILELDDR